VNTLTPPDSHHLSAAIGWLELGNHGEANEELEKISPALRTHPEVLRVRWAIYYLVQNWDACFEIASAMVKEARRIIRTVGGIASHPFII
jgi:hypothetical protein